MYHVNVWRPRLQHGAILVKMYVDPNHSDTERIHAQVSQWLKDHGESRHAAVYAVVGKDETVNFVGVSRNVALSVSAHVVNEGEERVHSLKVRSCRSLSTLGAKEGSQYIRLFESRHIV